MERWQMNNFLANNDLSQKRLITTCRHRKDGTRSWGLRLFRRILLEFIRLIKERTGHSPMIYTTKPHHLETFIQKFNRYRLLIANYNLPPQLHKILSTTYMAVETKWEGACWNMDYT